MQPDLQRILQEATRLTRQGDLQAATARIQAALRGESDGRFDAPPRPGDGVVIDVEAREVPGDSAAALPGRDGAPAGASAAARPPPASAPASARDTAEAFIAGRFGGAGAAGRDYKLYLPPDAGARPRPLLVLLHGCTQDADDFARGTRMNDLARAHGCCVLYPVQSQRANPQKCWNWFKHTHQQRDRGEPALLAGMVREVMARHAIDPARVYVAGLSAGGAMADILGRTHPDLFAAVGVHSGLPTGAARDLPSALEAMKQGAPRARPAPATAVLPTIVFHGSADGTVHPSNGEQVFSAAGAPAAAAPETETRDGAGRRATRRVQRGADGRVLAEHWLVHGAPHAWSGGSRAGSYTDPQGPDASAEMLRFFLEHPKPGAA